MKILVTAFDAFGGDAVNPALEAVKRLRGPDGADLVRLAVPTVFGRSIRVVHQKMKEEKPDAVVCVGQAGGRFGITPERVAINVNDASIPDNEGNRPVDEPVFPDGPAAYFTTLPAKEIVRAIRAGGLPSSLSDTAGTFVCNQLMYGVLYLIHHEFPEARGGFLHVPFLPEQAAEKPNTPSLSLADMTRGLEIALHTIAASCGRNGLNG